MTQAKIVKIQFIASISIFILLSHYRIESMHTRCLYTWLRVSMMVMSMIWVCL